MRSQIGADRIEARGPRPAGQEATLEARFSFSVSSEAVDRDRGGLERCLAPNEGLIQVTPRISALADACAAGAATPAETVRRFWDFILDNMCLGAVHYDAVASAPSAGEWALNSGWFDCQVGSALLASLCRARGVPARLLSGYLLYPAAPTFHFWVEVWLGPEGWTPFDLMGWDLSVGGRGAAWRDHFAGRVDARMTTTCMPLRFTGSPGVPYPPLWRVVSSGIPGGAATSVESVDTSALVLRDEVRIESIATDGAAEMSPPLMREADDPRALPLSSLHRKWSVAPNLTAGRVIGENPMKTVPGDRPISGFHRFLTQTCRSISNTSTRGS